MIKVLWGNIGYYRVVCGNIGFYRVRMEEMETTMRVQGFIQRSTTCLSR